MSSLKNYFHLTRDAFDIDPRTDADVYFGYAPLEERIKERIALDFVAVRHVPKFFIYGRYGSGKTHTLAHIEHVLTHDPEYTGGDFPATQPILTEVPPLRAKESWLRMHEHFLDAIGRALIKESVQAVLSGLPGDVVTTLEAAGALRFGDASLRNSQAQIFRNLLFGGLQETISWEWLKGRPLNLDQSSTLNTETNLTETSDRVAALLNVAALIWAGLNRKLVMLLDEAEMIRSITNDDALQEYIWAFRRLVADENDVLGLIVGFQHEGGMEEAPPVFWDEAVRTRVGGEAAFVDLGELVAEPADVKDFITAILGRLVDPEAAKQTIEEQSLPTEPEYFPFTPDAVDRVAEHILEDPDRKSPRTIKNVLSQAVGTAWRQGQSQDSIQLVDPELLEPMLYRDQLEP